MTPRERAETVATLYRWARWCDRHPDIVFDEWGVDELDVEWISDEVFDAAVMWCEDSGC